MAPPRAEGFPRSVISFRAVPRRSACAPGDTGGIPAMGVRLRRFVTTVFIVPTLLPQRNASLIQFLRRRRTCPYALPDAALPCPARKELLAAESDRVLGRTCRRLRKNEGKLHGGKRA